MEESSGLDVNSTSGGQSKVLVLYVGGTMGMLEDPKTGSLSPQAGYLAEVLRAMPELHAQGMPSVEIFEYKEPVDSSDMDTSDWCQIATDIEQNYLDFDGFVVLQGTDTLAYTASALSFMLENLGKCVVVTGSMIPLARGYSDARRNLIISVDIAGNSNVPEVCVFFHDRLLRGNRTFKQSTECVDAFASSNYPPLAMAGVSISYFDQMHRQPPKKRFRAHLQMDTGVVALRLIPGFDDHVFTYLRDVPSLKACIVSMYGTGNAPSRKRSLVDSLKAIIDTGKLVVVVSQCPTGTVNLNAYEVGRRLAEIGCLSGMDMTLEAVATKLSYLFGKGLNSKQVAKMLTEDLRGELTPESGLNFTSRHHGMMPEHSNAYGAGMRTIKARL